MQDIKQTQKRYGHLWATRSKPHYIYAVLPKCACSSIGQLFHFFDHGKFHEGGLIHEIDARILKAATDDLRSELKDIASRESVTRFTFVRNPYRRLLSAFADKVFGFQKNGRRYRQGAINAALGPYGLKWGPNANIAENFRCFVRFVGDTIETGKPMEPDIHYQSMYSHLQERLDKTSGWHLDFVGRVENFQADLDALFEMSGKRDIDLRTFAIPRENATCLPAMPMSAYFGPEEQRIVERVYAKDFEMFGYSTDPEAKPPVRAIDCALVNEELLRSAEKPR